MCCGSIREFLQELKDGHQRQDDGVDPRSPLDGIHLLDIRVPQKIIGTFSHDPIHTIGWP
jgi:hypothetical protein